MQHYLKIIFRNILKNKAFTSINVIGLTLGISCSLIMFLLVKEELSYNRYHSSIDSIYRIGRISMVEGESYPNGGSPKPMKEAILEDIVGVEKATLISHESYGLISVTEHDGRLSYYEEGPEVVYIEPEFFEIFDWKLLDGELLNNLGKPNTVVLAESIAKKYFSDRPAIGKTIRLNKKTDLQVVAVVEDSRKDSDFPFGIFISMETKRNNSRFDDWNSISERDVIFIQLSEGVEAQSIENQFPPFIEKHWDQDTGESLSLLLTPLRNYHFDQQFDNFKYHSASKQTLWVYTAIGIFLIVTACFNFINMSTAMAVKRVKEVGIRKTLGSSKQQLMIRYLGETFVITLFSLLLSIILVQQLIPLIINDFFQLQVDFRLFSDVWLMGYLAAILVIVSFLAGFYPAFILSAARPATALKGKLSSGGGNLLLRRGLVLIQFILCQLLIFSTIVTMRQLDFFLNADMGYDRELVMKLDLPSRPSLAEQDLWKSRMQAISGVKSYSFCAAPPFSGSLRHTKVYLYSQDEKKDIIVQFKQVDANYQETYSLELVAGNWLADRDTISHYIVNETFIKIAGIQDPELAIGKTIDLWDKKYPVVGVVKDFHAIDLVSAIEPMILFSESDKYETIGLKIAVGSTSETLIALKSIWNDFYPEYDFNHSFLDEEIRQRYKREQKIKQIITTFAGISILISCLGLYGLVAFVANQKAKEISIRKVLGASVRGLVSSFGMGFLKLVGVAFLVAAPVGYFVMEDWLQNFAYGIKIGPLVFVVSLGLSIIIALATTGYRSFKAATANPVDSLMAQ